MKIRVSFEWCDLWIGAYWSGKKRTLYLCLLPTLPIALEFKKKETQ